MEQAIPQDLKAQVPERRTLERAEQLVPLQYLAQQDAIEKPPSTKPSKNPRPLERIQLPQELPADVQQTAQQLQQLSNAEFDQAYMDEMVKDHEEDVRAFEQQAQSGQDPDLRAFAEETLPTLRDHLELAEQIRVQVTAATGVGPARERAAAVGVADRAG